MLLLKVYIEFEERRYANLIEKEQEKLESRVINEKEYEKRYKQIIEERKTRILSIIPK